ncbi:MULTISPECIES: 3-hydroxyacyl-ACP dehydratase FabZ [Oceanotoga]
MNIDEIMEILPHRYPFLLVDNVISMDEKSIKAEKMVSINEPYFQGHFPMYPLMPGVLLVEGMAQTAGILLLKDYKGQNVIPLFIGIDNCRFKKEVRPGDRIVYEVRIIQSKKEVYKLEAKVFVREKLAAKAEIMAGIKR